MRLKVIPSIDIFAGKTVRLTEGDFSRRKDYSEAPSAMAALFLRHRATEIHAVDLEGAKTGKIVNWDSIREILSVPKLEIQVGGGIRQISDLERLFEYGADRAVLGSVAAKAPTLASTWVKRFGGNRFCIALDLKDGKIATDGWVSGSDVTVDSVVNCFLGLGVRRFMSTDIRRDGKLQGPNLDLYRDLCDRFPKAEWIASGGVGSQADLEALATLPLYGAIVGKAIYEGKVDVEKLWP